MTAGEARPQPLTPRSGPGRCAALLPEEEKAPFPSLAHLQPHWENSTTWETMAQPAIGKEARRQELISDSGHVPEGRGTKLCTHVSERQTFPWSSSLGPLSTGLRPAAGCRASGLQLVMPPPFQSVSEIGSGPDHPLT